MAAKETLSARVDEDMKRRVTKYRDSRGLENTQDAVKELLNIGYREANNPLAMRFKSQMVKWSGDLGIMSVLALLAGFATPVLAPANAAVLAIGLASTAVVILGGLELARVVGGYSELGINIRRLLSEVRQ